jgi:hypothetical protein
MGGGGALSDERMGLSFTAVIISSTCHLYLQFYITTCCIVKSVVKSPVPCGYVLFPVSRVIPVYMYVQYIQIVSIETGYGLDNERFIVGVGVLVG